MVKRRGVSRFSMRGLARELECQPAALYHYVALDLGVVRPLTDKDNNYLRQNFLAFFRRDSKRVATLHVERG